MTVHSAIAKGLNFTADAAEYTMDKCGRLIVPASLGAIGGYLAGVGARLGGVQGAAAGTFYSFVLVPAGKYIDAHMGEGEDKIQPKTKNFVRTIGVIAETAIPIFITMKYGEPILHGLAAALPASFTWLVLPPATSVAYSVARGLLVNIAPAATQFCIETLRSAKQNSK